MRNLNIAAKIGTRFLIDFHRNLVLGNQRRDARIGIGFLLHHVAPVAPRGFEIRQDKALLLLALREMAALPCFPEHGCDGCEAGAASDTTVNVTVASKNRLSCLQTSAKLS